MSTIPQGTNGWKDIRKGLLTMSVLSAALGHSRFKTSRELAEEISELKKPVFDDISLQRMKLGNLREPICRDWYCQKTGYKVNETGFAYPKSMAYIGGSTDGDVITGNINIYNNIEIGEGCIEIKCPQRFYSRLDYYKPGDNIKDYIFIEHYDQMQGNMFISDKKWCDYIVYCIEENKVFTERIYRNEDYWNEVCKPGIEMFFENNNDIIKKTIIKQI